MTAYHCPTLAEYVQLWLSFRDAALRAELIAHREACPICKRLREVTLERRRSRTTDLHRQVSFQLPEQTTAELAGILQRLYTIIAIRPGDIGWIGDDVSAEVRRDIGSIRTDSTTGDMVSRATESEMMEAK